MAKRSAHVRIKRPPTRKPPPTARRGGPLLRPADVRMILADLAMQLAPADVTKLMEGEEDLRVRAATLPVPHLSLLRKQLDLALAVLRDHVDGACPQIPYYTIALLAAAVCYFSDELDVIPDFLPNVGRLDDAVVMAMACRQADAGLRRYTTWKGLDADTVLGNRPTRRVPRPRTT